MDWFQIGKGVHQGCILSPCLFNLYAEYIIWNAGLDESQTGIKIAGEINNLRYVDDITLMADNGEELKTRVKEKTEKAGLVSFIVQKILCLIWSYLFIFVFICIILGGGS